MVTLLKLCQNGQQTSTSHVTSPWQLSQLGNYPLTSPAQRKTAFQRLVVSETNSVLCVALIPTFHSVCVLMCVDVLPLTYSIQGYNVH